MQKLTLLALLISLELLFLLFSILILPINIKQISSQKEINHLEENQKVIVKGVIIKETNNTIKFDNNISASYKHTSPLINQTIKAQGIVTMFYNNKTIQIKKLSQLPK
jgi:hypothetical protein